MRSMRYRASRVLLGQTPKKITAAVLFNSTTYIRALKEMVPISSNRCRAQDVKVRRRKTYFNELQRAMQENKYSNIELA